MTKEKKSVDLLKEFEDVMCSGQFIIDNPRKVISISPGLDVRLGGGVLEGSTVIFTGPSKIGKTNSILQLCANAQKQGRRIFYGDAEHRVNARDLKNISSLDLSEDKFQMIRSSRKKNMVAHEFLETMEKLMNLYPNSVVVVDSFSALCTQEEKAGGMDKQLRADGAKLMAKFCRKVNNTVGANNILLIGVVHLMGNPSGYGGEKEGGGKGIAYMVDTKLRASHAEEWIEKDRPVGKKIHWKIICSPLGPPTTATSYFRYNYGLDQYIEVAHMAVDFGVIKQGGGLVDFTRWRKNSRYGEDGNPFKRG